MPLQTHQNDVPDLPNLSKYMMENIFSVNKDDDGKYYYNLSRTILAPDNLSNEKCYKYRIPSPTPLTNLSYKIYGRMELWWLICIINKIDNPVELLSAGTVLKILQPEYVEEILIKLKDSIK